jgi:hypothetical protein
MASSLTRGNPKAWDPSLRKWRRWEEGVGASARPLRALLSHIAIPLYTSRRFHGARSGFWLRRELIARTAAPRLRALWSTS